MEHVTTNTKQDIGWFDEHPGGEMPTAVTANMAKIQDGIGRKVIWSFAKLVVQECIVNFSGAGYTEVSLWCMCMEKYG